MAKVVLPMKNIVALVITGVALFHLASPATIQPQQQQQQQQQQGSRPNVDLFSDSLKNHYAYPLVKDYMKRKMHETMAKLPPAVADMLTAGDLGQGSGSTPEEALGRLNEAFKPRQDDDNSIPTPDMIVNAGYPVEIHSTTTEDGYILQMHRIPYGVAPGSGPGEGSKTPVYVQHCLLCSSADWVVTGPGEALGYMLADAGYDVWLGNIRGNTYSKKHETLSPDDDPEFWEYSWDEHGYYDVPAQMDLISAVTGVQEMFYIGHSMGTTMFFTMSNTRPEHRDRIRAMFALAPIARVDHMLSPIAYIAPFVNEVSWLLDFLGLNEFLPSDIGIDFIASFVCDPGWTQGICTNILFLLTGYNEAQLNQELLPTILGHTPAGTSTRTIVHYAQLVNSGLFQHYDYGSKEANLEHYGTEEPPEYLRSEITTPILAYWSDNDWLGQPRDVAWLLAGLPNLLLDFRVPIPEWNHMDFLWGIDADDLLYNNILENLNQLNSQ